MARRPIDHERVKREIIRARRSGRPLRDACERAGVHVSTACRWQNADPDFALEPLNAADRAAEEWYEIRLVSDRPPVRWRRDCPVCRARVVVRTARGRARFWRCGRWPLCAWASWRPRSLRNCPKCKGPRFWSHSRKSVACGACGMRISTP
jgi:ribosomal protein S27AE